MAAIHQPGAWGSLEQLSSAPEWVPVLLTGRVPGGMAASGALIADVAVPGSPLTADV